MFKSNFSLRNMAAIAVCLAAVIFSGCDPEELLSGEKAITAFGFTTPAATGVINEAAKTIVVDVPAGTDVKALAPVIAMSSPLATVTPGNGVPNDFTNPVTYTVTAQDGSTAAYTVTVNATGGGGEQHDANLILPDGQAWVMDGTGGTSSGYIFKGDGTYGYYWGTWTLTSQGTWSTSGNSLTINQTGVGAQRYTYTVANGTFTMKNAFGDEYVYLKKAAPSGGGNTGTPQELGSYIGESRTLADLGLEVDYIVPNWVQFQNNAVITVEAGVCIAFTSTSGSMTVTGGATIKMNGTADKPIQLRGAAANFGTEKGSWGYLYINTNSDNVLQYVECINGGRADDAGVVRIGSGAQVTMTNCTVNGSLGMGVSTGGSVAVFKKFENNTIKNCNKAPVYLDHISHAAAIDETSALAENAEKFITIGGYDYMNATDMTLKPATVPYHLSGWFSVEKALTVEAGVRFLMNTNASITVSNMGTLKMNGTAEKPITVDGYVNSTEKGSWQYIAINTNNANTLQYVQMTNGGDDVDGGVLRFGNEGKAAVDHCTIDGAKGYGITTGSGTVFTSFTDNKVNNCNKSPIYLDHIATTAAFDKSSTFTGNTDNYIYINGYDYLNDADLVTKGATIPYYLYGWTQIDKKWTVSDADFYMSNNVGLTVSGLGRIIATNCTFDRLPDMGYQWPSIGLGGDNGSTFTNCTFMNGGKDTDSGMVNINSGAAFAFTGCKFNSTTQYGVRINSSEALLGSTVTGSGNTFSGCTKGNVRLYNGTVSDNF
ncbi:MAG: DUF5018 domain-containing protein [Cytophagaceae bacterium]|jgi:hypothetical protein|nr:DUF5018 domain-containing protein [Cytophagaceae bacterium]